MAMSSLFNLTCPLWKTAVNLLSQNFPIESRALLWSERKTWAWKAASGICGKGNIAVCMDCIVSPLVSLTEMLCSVETLLMQGLSGPMKWLVHPKSTMSWRSTDGLRAGIKVLQEYKLFKTKESLGLPVQGLCQGSQLQFLLLPPFLSLRVASFYWPSAVVGHF